MNTVPFFGIAFRRFAAVLSDACKGTTWCRSRTWTSRFPFMRLDHVFLSSAISVEKVVVPGTKLTRIASDHLPLIVTLRIDE
jgi:endonuclease/exonuclease/phosphatase family metal-dependent hydrolase